jgi:hypothetical protein
MISVRLSDEEYADLKQLRSLNGARSVSDIARNAMYRFLHGAYRDELSDNHMDEFRAQLKSLDNKIEQLAAEITAFKAEGNTQ